MRKYVLRVTSRNAFGATTIRHWTIPEAMEDGFLANQYGAPVGQPGAIREFTVPLTDYYEEILSVTIAEHTIDDSPPQGYSERVEAIRDGFRSFLRTGEPTIAELVELMAGE